MCIKYYIVLLTVTGIILIMLAITFGCNSKTNNSAQKEFTIVVLPDTQHYSAKYPTTFLAQTQWIVDHLAQLNIICVVHEGDITNENIESEWQNADRAISLLENRVPYCLAVGNHDTFVNGLKKRDTTEFNKFFGISRLSWPAPGNLIQVA